MRRALALLFPAFLTAALAAQQPPTSFRAGIDLVQLDVSVLDGDRKPIRGLTAADFTVLEDGRPQTIAAFAAVDVPGPEPASTPWLRDVAPDVRTNIPADHRLVVIVMDDASIQNDPFALKNAKALARLVIDRLGPADLAAVVFTRDNRNAQDFTADRARLIAAVDHFSVGFRDMAKPLAGESYSPPTDLRQNGAAQMSDGLYYLYSAQIVGDVVRQLVDVPERRKTVFYVSQGIPMDVTAAVAGTPGSSMAAAELQIKILATLNDAFRRAKSANINFYSLDPCGMRLEPVPLNPTCVPGLEVEYLNSVAVATGGRAVVNTNDATQAVTEIFRENSAYYLLAYRPQGSSPGGTEHRLDVRVNRPGLTVRTRSSYSQRAADKPVKPGVADSVRLAKALSGVLPVPDIALQVHAAPFAQPGKDPHVAIVLGVHQTDLASASARVVEDLALRVMAFTPEGQQRASIQQDARIAVRASTSGEIQYEILTGIDLKPGRYELRLAAQSGRQRKSGSVYADVVVPDFSKEALSLSGIELAATPSPAAAPKDAEATWMPIVPTSRREFRPSDRVAVFCRVYQGGKGSPVPASIRTTLEDADGVERFSQTNTAAFAEAGPDRSGSLTVDLPIATLAPGTYHLMIEASRGGTAARRDLRFRILQH
jgi:VWFA-related protein